MRETIKTLRDELATARAELAAARDELATMRAELLGAAKRLEDAVLEHPGLVVIPEPVALARLIRHLADGTDTTADELAADEARCRRFVESVTARLPFAVVNISLGAR